MNESNSCLKNLEKNKLYFDEYILVLESLHLQDSLFLF